VHASRKIFGLAIVLSLLAAACGGGESAGPRLRNSALVGSPCLSEPRAFVGPDLALVAEMTLCDEANDVYWDGVSWKPDAATRKVQINFNWPTGRKLTQSLTVRRASGEYVAVDEITLESEPCSDGGFCGPGEIDSTGKLMVIGPYSDPNGHLALWSNDVHDEFLVPRGADIRMPSLRPDGDYLTELRTGYNNTERLLGADWARGSDLVRYINNFQNVTRYSAILPSRSELSLAFSLAAQGAPASFQFEPGVEYLSSSFTSDGRVWVRSTDGERLASLLDESGDLTSFNVRFLMPLFPRPQNISASIQNAYRPPVTTTSTTEAPLSPETSLSPDTSAAPTDTTVVTTPDSTPDSIAQESEPPATAPNDEAALTADDLTITSIVANGTGIQRTITVDTAASNDVLTRHQLELWAIANDGSNGFVGHIGTIGTTFSTVQFDDVVSYVFYVKAVNVVDTTEVVGTGYVFIPNSEPIDRSVGVESPSDLFIDFDGYFAIVRWKSPLSYLVAPGGATYTVKAQKVGGDEKLGTTGWCCGYPMSLADFEVGAEYEFSVSAEIANGGTKSAFSEPLRVVPLKEITPDQREAVSVDCETDPSIVVQPDRDISTRTKLSISVTHPCIGNDVLDESTVQLSAVEIMENGEELHFHLGCASANPRRNECDGTLGDGTMTTTVYMQPGTFEIRAYVISIVSVRPGINPYYTVKSASAELGAVADEGTCSSSDIVVRDGRLSLDCDIDYSATLFMSREPLGNANVEQMNLSPGRSVSLRGYETGWVWMRIEIRSGMNGGSRELLYCASSCETSLGNPALPISVTGTSMSIDASRLSTWNCEADGMSAKVVGISLRNLGGGAYEMIDESYFLIGNNGEQTVTRDLIGGGGVDIVGHLGGECGPGEQTINVAFIVSPSDLPASGQSVSDVGSKLMVDVGVLASADIPAALNVPTTDASLIGGSQWLEVGTDTNLAIRFDDGQWMPASIVSRFGARIPAEAKSLSVRTTVDGETRIVTREITRRSEAGSTSASASEPEVTTVAAGSGADSANGRPPWLLVLGILVLVVAAGSALALTRKRYSVR
jgi:hypothetical protein